MKNIIYIKDYLHGEKDSRKGKQINKCRKKIIGLKIKIKKKENSTELQNPNVEAEIYNDNKKYYWGKKCQKLN